MIGFIKKPGSGRAANTFTFDVPVTTDWTIDESNSNIAYCTCAVSGVRSTDNPIVDVVLGDDADANELYISAFAMVSRVTAGDGYIKLYSYEGSPQVAFTIQLKVVR